MSAKNTTFPHSQFARLCSLDPPCYQTQLSTKKSVEYTSFKSQFIQNGTGLVQIMTWFVIKIIDIKKYKKLTHLPLKGCNRFALHLSSQYHWPLTNRVTCSWQLKKVMIYFFSLNQPNGKKYQYCCFYLHIFRDSVSPVWGIFT